MLQLRDISTISSLTALGVSTIYEAEEFKEKDQAPGEAFARRPKQTGQAKTETAGGRGSKGAESREEIGCPHYCHSSGCGVFYANQKEVSRASYGRDSTTLA
jgi:hypothetical protein